MRSLSANFKAALRQSPNTPSFIVKAVQSEILGEVDSQTDWLDSALRSNVDLTTDPGSVLIPKTTPSGITQASYNSVCNLGSVTTYLDGLYQSPATPGTDSFAWQSFKQSSGSTRYINKVSPHLYATGTGSYRGWYSNIFYVQLFDAKNGTAISTLKTVGGYNYSVDARVDFDFSSELIPMVSGTTYWIKIYSLSRVFAYRDFYTTATSAIRYHSTVGTYADGQLDAKPYSGAESVNCGDLAFAITFLDAYAGHGMIASKIDTITAPSVDGEWRINKLTPLDSVANITAWAVPDIDSYTGAAANFWSGLAGKQWKKIVGHGDRYVAIGNNGLSGGSAVWYTAHSDDHGDTWTLDYTFTMGIELCDIVRSRNKYVITVLNSRDTYTSDDGVSWSNHATVLPAGGVSNNWAMAYNDAGRILAIETSQTNLMATSDDDGVSWTSRSGGAYMWGAPIWTGTAFFCIMNSKGTAAQSSTDGASWTPRTMPYSKTWGANYTAYYTAMGGKIVAFGWEIGAATDYVSRSTDNGATWNSITAPTNTGFGMSNDGLKFISTGTSLVQSSPDGETWTQISTSAPGQYPAGVVGRSVWIYSSTQFYKIYHTGRTYLGAISDGLAITTRTQYYLTHAALKPDTTGSATSALLSVQAYFPTWAVFSTTPEKGYEPSVSTIGSLSTTIDSFKPFTVGQVSLGLALTDNVSTWLNTSYPRNKEVRLYAGFTEISEADYANYYRGRVEEWSIDNDRKVTVSLRDFAKTWKDKPVPLTWQSVSDDKTWTAQHPVDVMLDLLQGYVGAQSSEIDAATFAEVKTALSGWVVTNTITGETSDSAALLEQLRFITGTYFIPQSNGRNKLKRWDPTEAAAFDLTDNEMIDVRYKGNSASLVNLLNWYFNMKPDGTAKGGGIALHQEQDGASQFNWGEKKTKEFKDYWTLTAQEVAQVYPVAGAIINRYAQVPSIISFQLDLRFMELEVGDMINITTRVAPSSDLAGISAVKYQVTRCDLTFDKSRIKIEALRAA